MSMQTDSAFVRAIASSKALMDTIGGRVYGTAVPLPDQELDNVPLPYAVVTFDGLANDTGSKDSGMEGEEDNVTVSVELAAKTLDGLHALASATRTAIREYMEDVSVADDDRPTDYALSAGPIQYDPSKPCYWMRMTYRCTADAA